MILCLCFSLIVYLWSFNSGQTTRVLQYMRLDAILYRIDIYGCQSSLIGLSLLFD